MVVSIEDIPQTKIIPAGRKASGGSGSRVEAAIGIEPMYRGFADLCLTAWLRRQPANLVDPVARDSTRRAGGCQSGGPPRGVPTEGTLRRGARLPGRRRPALAGAGLDIGAGN